MGAVLDTAVLIATERGTFDLPSYVVWVGDAPVALAAGSAVATLNDGEFRRVPGLVLAPYRRA